MMVEDSREWSYSLLTIKDVSTDNKAELLMENIFVKMHRSNEEGKRVRDRTKA